MNAWIYCQIDTASVHCSWFSPPRACVYVCPGRSERTRCTATAACAGSLTGWRAGTRSPGSPAAPGRRAWRASCCSPHRETASSAQVRDRDRRLREKRPILSGFSWNICSPSGPVDPSVSEKCSPCSSNPCQNHGRCRSDPVHQYKCSCPQGYKVLSRNMFNCFNTSWFNCSTFKGTVHLKTNIWWKCAHPQAIWDVDEFVSSSDLDQFSIKSLAHQWRWMGAIRMRVQTADKNITVIHTTPVHQLMSWDEKICACKK